MIMMHEVDNDHNYKIRYDDKKFKKLIIKKKQKTKKF